MDLIDFLTSRPLYLKTAKKHCVYHVTGTLISLVYLLILATLIFIVFINDEMVDLGEVEKVVEKVGRFGGLMYVVNCVVFKIHSILVNERWQQKSVF